MKLYFFSYLKAAVVATECEKWGDGLIHGSFLFFLVLAMTALNVNEVGNGSDPREELGKKQ